MTNTLAYMARLSKKEKKSFIGLPPGNNFSSIYQDILLAL
jgi:hypothetical protein